MGKHALLFVLAALVVGGLAGFFLGAVTGGDGERPAPRLPVADEPTGPVVLPELSLPPTDEQEPPVHDVQTRNEPETDVQRDGLSAWIESLDVPPAPTGTGRFWGVATVDGQPLAGVQVRAIPQLEAIGPAPDEDSPIEEALRHFARQRLQRTQSFVETVTGPDGRYELAGLADVDYTLRATISGYTLKTQRLFRLRPDLEIDLEFTAVGTLLLDVRLPNGSQPARARVQTHLGRQSRTHFWFPNRAQIELEPGKYMLEVTSEGYEADSVMLELRAGEQIEHTARLIQFGSIVCRVLVEGPSARVYLVADPPSQPPTRIEGRSEFGSLFSPATFVGLQPGRYRVMLVVDRKIAAWKDVDVGHEPVDVILSAKAESPEDRNEEEYIRVRVIVPEGVDAGRFTMSAAAMRGEFQIQTSRRTVEMPDGEHWIERPTTTNAQWFQVRVDSTALGTLSLRHEVTDTGVLEARFQAPATLFVTVPGANAHPHRAELTITLVPEHGSNNIATRIRADGRSMISEGRLEESMRFSGQQPGRYRLMISRMEAELFVSSARDYETITVDLQPGENHQTVSIPTLYRLTLVPVGGQELTHVRVVGEGVGITTRPGDQPYDVGFLKPGTYTVTHASGHLRFNLTRDTELRLEFEPYTALRLSRVTPGGQAHEMGLRNGDLLIAVGGVDPQDAAELRKLLTETAEETSVTWTIIRDGVTMTLQVSGPVIASLRAERGLTVAAATRD